MLFLGIPVRENKPNMKGDITVVLGRFPFDKLSEIFGQKSDGIGKVPGKKSEILGIRFESTLSMEFPEFLDFLCSIRDEYRI